jgi:glycosyltransferase involved in cell wall biosynthesis
VRIALVSDTYTPQVNGVTTVVNRIAQALPAAGHAVAVVAPAYPGPPPESRGDELRIPSLPFPPYPSIRLSLPFARRVNDFLDRFAPDLVHVHTEGSLGTLGRRWTLRHGRPLVTTFHTHFPQYARHYGVPRLEPLVWRWLTWFHGPARVTYTPGDTVHRELIAKGLTQARVWGRGVDTRRFHPSKRDNAWRDRWRAGPDDVVVLHVGRLAPEKGLDVLIDTWQLGRRVLGPRVVWAIAGRGPLERRLAAELPWVRRAGFLDRDDLAALYASAEICMLPSETETCGLVALEAMASGLPVVAADAGGLRESVEHEVSGLLVPSGDAHGFLSAVARLVIDRQSRHAFSLAARARAESRDQAAEDEELLAQYAALLPRDQILHSGVAPCAA